MLAATVLSAALIGCVYDSPPREVAPVNTPMEAFEVVGEPRNPGGTNNRDADNLSQDVQRLQQARKRYQLDMERRRYESERRQADCRAQAGSSEVAIQDGGGRGASYCQIAD